MTITRFHVVLEQAEALFVSGSTIRGILEVVADADTECREIMMRAKGWATLSFILSRAQEKPDTNEEYFLDQSVTVWQGSELGAMLKKGEYSLPFKFLIPPNCPPTFKGDYGKIKYKIEGYAGSPWDPPSVCEVKFQIAEPYDLNEDHDARKPIRISSEETVCCGCCRTGPVTISLTAPKSGYTPGEEIVLFGEINNGTKMKIKDITLKIIQRTIYKAKNGNQKKEKKVIKRVELPGIPARQAQELGVSWFKERMYFTCMYHLMMKNRCDLNSSYPSRFA
ncbi:unnamed protein product [Meganyctiphanes norvegica]|uniref:Arrestin C-terminal-like domain-containing protein n=1 Tax=Meganyctiphanes norvegica TaxID=48144 RepID=A0AAV2QQ64_MEGNR